MQGHDQQQSVLYFTVLIIMEILIFIFTLASNQKNIVFFNLLRILMLVAAKCLKSISWIVQYIIFTIICALYCFDPVGLWITGHGQIRTGPQNAFCVITFILLLVAVYIAYLFKRNFEKEIDQDFVGQGYSNPNNSKGYSNPNAQGGYNSYSNQQPQYLEQQRVSNYPNRNSTQKQFQQFTGQAYSLA